MSLKIRDDQKILIIRTDRIGDVVLTTPAIQALRGASPKAHIAMLVAPLTYDLVDGNPYLDEVLVDDRKNSHKGLFGFLKLIKELRIRHFDVVINFHTKKRTNLLSFFAGIKERVGYCNEKFGFLLTQKIVDTRPQGTKHEVQYCLDVLNILGISASSNELFLPVQIKHTQWVDQLFKEKKIDSQKTIIAIHPESSCPTKKWPVKYFKEVIEFLMDQYDCSVILIGTQKDQNIAEEIQDSLDGEILDLTAKTSVGQLSAVLKRCKMLISNDSGPVHMAAALKIAVISIFTRNQPGINPERWRPLGPLSRVIFPPLDNDISFAKGELLDPRYLEKIQPSQVLEAVDALFKLC